MGGKGSIMKSHVERSETSSERSERIRFARFLGLTCSQARNDKKRIIIEMTLFINFQ